MTTRSLCRNSPLRWQEALFAEQDRILAEYCLMAGESGDLLRGLALERLLPCKAFIITVGPNARKSARVQWHTSVSVPGASNVLSALALSACACLGVLGRLKEERSGALRVGDWEACVYCGLGAAYWYGWCACCV